jgi:hypothetical protein
MRILIQGFHDQRMKNCIAEKILFLKFDLQYSIYPNFFTGSVWIWTRIQLIKNNADPVRATFTRIQDSGLAFRIDADPDPGFRII